MFANSALDAVVLFGHVHKFESFAHVLVVLEVSFHVLDICESHVFALLTWFLVGL